MDIDMETKKILLETLEKVKAHGEMLRQRREAKRWRDIAVPLKLSDGLARLTKDQLMQICENLEFRGLSAMKKQDLIEALQERIPQHIERTFLSFDQERYDIAHKLVHGGGYAVVSDTETDRLDFFRMRGIAFTGMLSGQKVLAMPQEIAEKFKRINTASYCSIVRRNTEWVKLAQGMLYYYGTLTAQELETMLVQYTGEPVPFLELFHVMHDAIDFYGEMRLDTEGYSNVRVWDAKRVKQEHRARPDLDFFPFTKEQLIQAGEPGFVERNACYRSFVSFICDHYEISRTRADQIVEECVYAIQIGESVSDMMQYLQSQLEMDDLETLQAFMDKVVLLNNHTRQWFLKGYAPLEIWQGNHASSHPSKRADVIHLATRKKIGRNDPCPCGSGKKFKKCCGN